jgi:hypothetical protein
MGSRLTLGRSLGRTVHSQLSLLPLPDLPHTITHLSLAQDHTLALTSGGYILSWGHNRFSQLGYPIEAADNPHPSGKFDDTVQVSPRRIVGPLKKEWVDGVAAGRMSSACWTKEGIWTWGTNAGHLGYEKMGNPVQVLPRKVTAITQGIIDIALSVSLDGGCVGKLIMCRTTLWCVSWTTTRYYVSITTQISRSGMLHSPNSCLVCLRCSASARPVYSQTPSRSDRRNRRSSR